MFNFVKLKPKQSIRGIYVGYFKDIGAFRKPVFAIKDVASNETMHLWGTVVLNMEMFGIPFRSLLEITYLGKVKTDHSKWNVNSYKVQVIEPPKSSKKQYRKGGSVSGVKKRFKR